MRIDLMGKKKKKAKAEAATREWMHPPETGRVWRTWEHNSWGDNVAVQAVLNDGSGSMGRIWRFYGLTTPVVRRGDIIECRAKETVTGEKGVARFLVYDYEHKIDPPDMWFADAVQVDWPE